MNNILNFLISPVFAQGRSRGNTGFVGDIVPPTGIPADIVQTTPFLSTIIRFLIIIAGLFTLWQFLLGGLGMITAGGDKGKVAEAQNKITGAITGLIIITASFIIIGIVSQILFQDYMYILNPTLQVIP